MSLIQNKSLMMLVCIAWIALLFGCNKDKTPTTATSEPTLWEKVNGNYKVYDTSGVYLYDMSIVHIHVNNQVDSLRFENFDGKFTFTVKQSTPNPNNYPNLVTIGFHNPIYDSNSKRWQLGGGADIYYNSYNNDTIPLLFQKTNINYYIEDVVPYYSCNCKQIAVKQH